MALFLLSHGTATMCYMRNFFTKSAICSSQLPSQSEPSKSSGPSPGLVNKKSLNATSRFSLVFSGKYKSAADIPDYVSMEVLQKAKSKARIKISNVLMLITMLGCLSFAYSGRKAAERGESVSQMNMDWHKEYAEKMRKEEAEKK